jgi:hypothetical protein
MGNLTTYIKNQLIINNDCMIYGVLASDIIKLINEDKDTNEWTDTHYLNVSKALREIDNLIKKNILK